MRSGRLLSALLIVMPAVAAAQGIKPDPSYRDPGTATIYSVVLPGGGQLYSGETKRGLAMLVGSGAAVLAGTALSSPATCDYDPSSFSGLSCKEANYTPRTIGLLAYAGIWAYGIFDAKKSAERQNTRRSKQAGRIEPLVTRVADKTILGVQLGF